MARSHLRQLTSLVHRQVIANLGLLDSRIHLVGMADAVMEDSSELENFKRQIPRIAQMLIPRWREKLYLPRARCLEEAMARS
jgi:hypothetical protein